ncbi:hypothetical protein B484DRAFT_447686 [Ochromonadaceae sp. CCMP2298]|nr:hypothetical protein B484DRAFT_447686 [Ochromonadaceae sp. CCMP2298]
MISIRRVAALTCAGTLAWDFFIDSSVHDSFSVWALFVHFIYFQLPLQSKALAYLHSTSFIGASLIPAMYTHQLCWNPRLELNNMETWEMNWTTVVVRAVLINVAPLAFHVLDISANKVNLINSYKTKPSKVMIGWSISSFILLGFIFELIFPETEETSELQGITRNDFLKRNKAIGCIALCLSFTVLYLQLLQWAYPQRHKSHS